MSMTYISVERVLTGMQQADRMRYERLTKHVPKIYAGPFVGEFGFELWCWVGRLRYLARENKVYVACAAGHEYLYADFAEDILPLTYQRPNALRCISDAYQNPTFKDVWGHEPPPKSTWIKPNEIIVNYNWKDPKDLPEQDFVYYGMGDGYHNTDGCTFDKTGRFPDCDYDVAFHARNREQSKERNWPAEKWKQLAEIVQGWGCNVCTIGGEDSAYVAGKDLRGGSIFDTCFDLARTALVVGESSGPIHLANLCGCGVVTWFGTPYDERNLRRYTTDWNIDPEAPNVVALHVPDWNPSVDEVQYVVGNALIGIYGEVPVQ